MFGSGRGAHGAAATGLGSVWLSQKERKAQREAKARVDIEAKLKAGRVEQDETIARLRKRPHAQLLGLDDEVLMGMARQLHYNEELTKGAEQRIGLAKEKKAGALRYTKLHEWVSDNHRGGLQDLKKVQVSLKKELRGRPKKGMKWNEDVNFWEKDPNSKDEPDTSGIDDDSVAQSLIAQAKAVAASSPQTSLLLYKAAAFYYTATGQDRPKLFQRINDMENSVHRLKEAGMFKAVGIVLMDEDAEGADAEGADEGKDVEERAVALKEEMLATDPRSALQMAKDIWGGTKESWKSRNSEVKKVEIEEYQANIKLAIVATAKRRALAKLHSEALAGAPGADPAELWETYDEQWQKKRLAEAEATVDADRRANAAGKAAMVADTKKSSGKGKKKGSQAAVLVNKILAHHSKLKSILDEIKEEGSMREEIESKVCGDLLECDDTILKITATRNNMGTAQITKRMQALEEKTQENERESMSLNEKLDERLRKAAMRFQARNHPDKPDGLCASYPDPSAAWLRCEKAISVMSDRNARLLYFSDESNENVTASPEVEERVIRQITGAMPNKCTNPWLTTRPDNTLAVDWSCSGAAFSGVHTYRLEAARGKLLDGFDGRTGWMLIYESSHPGTCVEPKYREWTFRSCAINRFGSGPWSAMVSLAAQEQEQRRQRSVASSRGGGAGGPAVAQMTAKEALEQRRKQEAREQVQYAMSSMGQRAVNAHDVLIDSVAAFKKQSKNRPDADDYDLIGRALSLVETLKNRRSFKAEIGEWKHTLKHQSMAEFAELLIRIEPEELNPTVTNMIKQSIDKRMGSEDPSELREVLLAAAQRADVFQPKWQSDFYQRATEMEGKMAKSAAHQARREKENAAKELAREAAVAERARRQEEEEAYRYERELSKAQVRKAHEKELTKAQKKNERRRAKKQEERSNTEQEDAIKEVERQRLEVERQEAEREAERDRRARQKDDEEQERLQQIIQQEQWQQQQEDLHSAWKSRNAGGGGGSSGWEGIDDGQVEDKSTVSQHVRAGNPEEGGFPTLRKVATQEGKKGKKGGRKGKKASMKSASANKQPATPVREWHASKEGEAEPEHVGGGGGGGHLQQFGGGAGSPEQQRYLAESVAQLKRQQQHAAQQAALQLAREQEVRQLQLVQSEQQAALAEAERDLSARERDLDTLRQNQAQAAMQQMQSQAQAEAETAAATYSRGQAASRERVQAALSTAGSRQQSRLAAANAPAPVYQTAEVVTDVNPDFPELVSEASVVMAQPVMSPMSTAPPVIVSTAAPAPSPAASAAPPQRPALTVESLEEDEDYSVLLAFLSAQGMTKHKDLLIQNEVSFDTMLLFGEDDYKELGIAKGPRVKMLRTCNTWKAEQLQKLQQNLA